MLTVLFATRNRARILGNVLTAFSALAAPPGGWKLVVVDNGSGDATQAVLQSFKSLLPLEVAVESTPGKNSALNTGLREIEGDLVVLTDDDVFPSADWLLRIREAADSHPDVAVFGGSIEPRWEVDPPPWVRFLELGPIYTLTPSNLHSGPLDGSAMTYVWGPNMAIRRSVFDSGMRFDPRIGPRGDDYPMGSETEFILRLMRRGYRGWHVECAKVQHFIRREQLEQRWVLQRAIRCGRGIYRMTPAPEWLGMPRHLLRDIPRELLALGAAVATFDEAARLNARWRLNVLRGKLRESRIIASERKDRAHRLNSDDEPISG
jgi:glycosyltransferase involved in cell wall biosynthesis